MAVTLNALGAVGLWALLASLRDDVAACDASCDAANRAAVNMQAAGTSFVVLGVLVVLYPLVTFAAAAAVGAARSRAEGADGMAVAWAYLWPHWVVASAAVVLRLVAVASGAQFALSAFAAGLLLLVAPTVGAFHAASIVTSSHRAYPPLAARGA